MSKSGKSLFVRAITDHNGQILPWMALLMVLFFGMAGLTLDLGHAYVCYRDLQASTDAAALAGAYTMSLTTTTTTAEVTTVIDNYSSLAGAANANPNLPAATVTVTPSYECNAWVTNLGTPCYGPGGTNALRVVQSAVVPTIFIRVLDVFGIKAANSITLRATSTAAMKGATPAQYNVAMVVDTTASMGSNDNDADCSNTRIDCALEGVQTMLKDLSPCGQGSKTGTCTSPFDQVALFTFPPVQANTATDDTTCPTKDPTITPYTTPIYNPTYTAPSGTAGTYQITTYQDNYSSTNQKGGALNSGSVLTIATGGGTGTKGHPCSGLQTPGGDGTYYAGAIYQALSSLAAQQAANPGSYNALIILGDGDAPGTGSSAVGLPASGKLSGPTYGSAQDECAQAVAAAQTAKSMTNTTVYTISYGTPKTGCSSDVYNAKTNPLGTNISPCQALLQMATTPSDFYSDADSVGAGGCVAPVNAGLSLDAIFTALSGEFTHARLIPNNVWT